jgi:hypothetical protein
MALGTLATTAYGAYTQNKAGREQQNLANANAALLESQAKDEVAIGEEEVLANRRRVRKAVGQQRADFAGQGVDVGSGTALDIQNETQEMGAVDEATIRRNAFRRAWNINTQASNQRLGGKYARRAGRNQAIGTVLGGVGQASSYWDGSAPTVSGAGGGGTGKKPTTATRYSNASGIE